MLNKMPLSIMTITTITIIPTLFKLVVIILYQYEGKSRATAFIVSDIAESFLVSFLTYSNA